MKKEKVDIGFVPQGPTEKFFTKKILAAYEFYQYGSESVKDVAITGVELINDI